jgi:L-fucose isomerase-like protein
MVSDTIVAVLPVGELDIDMVRSEFDAMLSAIRRLGTKLIVAEPAIDKEAAVQAAQQLAQKNPDILAVIPLRGLSAQTIESACMAGGLPSAILPVQDRYALPSGALAVGALCQAGIPVQLLYAPPAHPEFGSRLACILRAARAFTRVKQSRIGIIGSLFPNLVGCRYDATALTEKLGIRLLPIPFEELRQVVQGITQEGQTVGGAMQAIISSFTGAGLDHYALTAGSNLHLALKQIAQDRNIDGFATECWSGFPREIGLNPCLGFVEDSYILACEGDVQLCAALLVSRYLTGRSAYVGDLYNLDTDGLLTLVHCGAPASLASDKSNVVLGHSQLAQERGFETLTCRPRLEKGPVTIFRLYGLGCDQLHLSSGELLGSEQSPNLTVKIKIAGDRWVFLEHCTGNHYAVVVGDWRAELKQLAKWLNITLIET